MAIVDFTGTTPRNRRSDAREMQLMMLVIYPLCLAAAVLSRLLPRTRHEAFEAAQRRSVFAEAGASAAACIPFVFR